jgi:hypothetical protein
MLKLSLLFLLLPFGLLAQRGVLVLKVTPGDALVHIDGKKYEGKDTLELAAGWHRLEVWKAGHDYRRDSIQIKEGETFTYNQDLPLSEPYQAYLQEEREYQAIKYGTRFLVPAAFLGWMTIQGVAYAQSNTATERQYNQALTWAEQQSRSVVPDEIQVAEAIYAVEKDLYNIQRASFERRQNTLVTAGIIGGLAVVALEYLSFRLDPPEFKEVPRLTLSAGSTGQGIALHYNMR